MAKRKTKTQTVAVAAPAPRRRAPRAAASPTTIRVVAPAGMQSLRKRAHKVGGRVRKSAIAGVKGFLGVTQNQLIAVAGAAGLAFIQKQGVAVPKLISSLSTPANAGIIAWGAARLLKSTTLDHVATGMLSVAAYSFAAGTAVSGDVMGDGRAVVFEGDDLDGDDD